MENLSTLSAIYWHALNLVIPGNLWKLKDISIILGGSKAVFEASQEKLQSVGLAPVWAAKLASGRPNIKIQEEWSRLQEQGIKILVKNENSSYPRRLAQIDSAPPIIYIRGNEKILSKEGLAVVGSRKLSSYGRQAVKSLVPPLAGAGINIISGMAYGADAAALEACLESDGVPIAVLASSLAEKEIEPRPHLELAQRIEAAGCLVSENAPGTAAYKSMFPLRNRIISGLSMGVLVIEAAKRSGSGVTARLGLEQNREIFAVPGSIFAPDSEGTLELIKQGAKCVTTTLDITREFGWDLVAAAKSKLNLTNPFLKTIYDLLAQEATTIDVLVRKTNRPVPEIITALTELEMAGTLRRSGNGVYHTIT